MESKSRVILCLIFLIFFPFGCTISTNIYIINLTNYKQVIQIDCLENSICVEREFEYSFYENEKNILENLKGSFNQKIRSKLVDGNYYLTIPPRSSLLIEKTHNYVSTHFVSVRVNNREFLKDSLKWDVDKERISKTKEGYVSWFILSD